MKTIFVKDLTLGQKFTSEFQVTSTDMRQGAKGPFLLFKVRDRTGEVSGSKWGAKTSDLASCAHGSIVSMTGTVKDYPEGSGSLTINITEVHPVLECDPEDFVPVSVKSHDDLCEDVKRLMDAIEDPWLNKLVRTILSSKDGYMWRVWPAAKSVHHAVKHGLMQHSVEVAQFAEGLCMIRDSHGYDEKINRSLVIAGALLHDIGKVYEYTETQNGAYDVGHGGLLGHIVLGIQVIVQYAKADETMKDCSHGMLTSLLHIVTGHHGIEEHGSPVRPMMPEAHIVHLADSISARLYIDWDARQKHTGAGLYAKHIDGRAYCPKG